MQKIDITLQNKINMLQVKYWLKLFIILSVIYNIHSLPNILYLLYISATITDAA